MRPRTQLFFLRDSISPTAHGRTEGPSGASTCVRSRPWWSSLITGDVVIARPRDPGERAAMAIGAFCATGRRSGATHRANALYRHWNSLFPPCSARASRASSRQTKPPPIRLWPEIVADTESTARNRHRAPNRPKRQTVALAS
jgi:hypothetical protein